MSNRDKMMENLLNKYEQGLCSVEEQVQVEQYLAQMEQDFIPGYGELKGSVDQSSLDLDVESLINRRDEQMEQMLSRYELGISDLQEANIVEAFLADQDRVNLPYYDEFISSEKKVMFKTEVSSILEKAEVESLLHAYENGSISDIDVLKVESIIESLSTGDIPGYDAFIQQEKAVHFDINIEDLIAPEAKVVPLGSLSSWRQWSLIAASLVFVIAAIFVLKPDTTDTVLASQDTNTIEIEDADEALEFTLAALGLTSKNMKKGTDNMKHLQDLQHTQIYK